MSGRFDTQPLIRILSDDEKAGIGPATNLTLAEQRAAIWQASYRSVIENEY
jgi:hypothetical protein